MSNYAATEGNRLGQGSEKLKTLLHEETTQYYV